MMRSENSKQLNCEVYCIFFLYELNCNGIDLNQRLTTKFIHAIPHYTDLICTFWFTDFRSDYYVYAISCYT